MLIYVLSTYLEGEPRESSSPDHLVARQLGRLVGRGRIGDNSVLVRGLDHTLLLGVDGEARGRGDSVVADFGEAQVGGGPQTIRMAEMNTRRTSEESAKKRKLVLEIRMTPGISEAGIPGVSLYTSVWYALVSNRSASYGWVE